MHRFNIQPLARGSCSSCGVPWETVGVGGHIWVENMDEWRCADASDQDAPPDGRRPSFGRRSQRIPLIMPVEVSGQDAKGESFSFTTTATNLNRNGATLHVNRDLPIDRVIVLQNSRGARTSARIVAQTNIVQDLCSYGVEFVEADGANDFWGISFPSRWLDLRTS